MNPVSDFALREALKGIIYALTSDGIYQPDIEWNEASEDLYSELIGLQGEIVQLVMSNSEK